MGTKRIMLGLPPEQILLWAIFIAIGIGAILLSLPIAQVKPVALLDVIFTTASATTVNGMFTVPIDDFTLFGKAVILFLIQIGGLGLITMTFLFLSMFMNLGLGSQLMAGQILEIESWKQIKKVLILIILVTLCCEFVGTLCIFGVVASKYPVGMAWFVSLFHAISSFCSAGITLLEGGMSNYSHSYVIVIVTMALMYIGELGFITWQEIGNWVQAKREKKPYRFSLHSKIVLYASTMLLICTGIIFWILEHKNILANEGAADSILSTLFYAISFRSTGFLLTSIGSFHLASIMLIMFISFIGSAPGSTGSGVKVTTFAIFLATIRAAISGKTIVSLKGRSIALSQVYRAMAIISLGLGWVILSTFCLLITEQGFTFIQVLFESMSAFSSLGMSTGITASLSTFGKFFIIISMIIGRIGSFTLILALKLKKRKEAEFSYPEERVMLG
jgi:trk system potassium uptake protein